MAGTLPHLPLSTQFDKDSSRPLKGGRLQFYAANAPSSPAIAYKDVGLTLPWGDRIMLDGAGRVPNFYLPDGNIGVRLTNSRGVIQFEEANLLVIGPSSGGGGGSVDPTTIFQTGDTIWLDQAGTRAGWVRDNGRTIGAASSGASERANSDCEALFLFLWNTYNETLCPVLGGRGASAAADWAANKQITLPDKRGYVPGGIDGMGNSLTNRYNGVPFVLGNGLTVGSVLGEAMNTLTTPQIPSHIHLNSLNDPSHSHTMILDGSGVNGAGVPQASAAFSPFFLGGVVQPAFTGMTITNAAAGGGGAHNNTQLTVLGTFYRKL